MDSSSLSLQFNDLYIIYYFYVFFYDNNYRGLHDFSPTLQKE